jgi:hypothetical protein
VVPPEFSVFARKSSAGVAPGLKEADNGVSSPTARNPGGIERGSWNFKFFWKQKQKFSFLGSEFFWKF